MSSGEADSEEIDLPRKKFYRQRAHANPMSDHDLVYPICPDRMDWKPYYGDEKGSVEFLDVGCGYGGLLFKLAEIYPTKLILGLEIRVKVCDFVQDKIKAMRIKHPGQYGNVACLRTNAMKYLVNFVRHHQLSKMFFLFPDPHFKRAKHKRRIISRELLAIYAYLLKPRGIIYTITDVEDLHLWMLDHLSQHPLFEQLRKDELERDPVVHLLNNSTEEAQKVARNGGKMWFAVFRRLPDPE